MELQFNIAGLLKEHSGSKRAVELDGARSPGGDTPPAAVTGRLTLTRTDRGVWASGAVVIAADQVCSRCLVPFVERLQVQVDDEFLPPVDIDTGRKVRYGDEPDADTESIDVHHVLDLEDLFRQYAAAARPLAPVCREDCAGLCPTCGTDLNESACTCEPAIDPRWATLRELLR